MDFQTPLSAVKGVGAKTAEKLAAAGFLTAADLINFVPRAYDDFSNVVKIADLTPGKRTIRARCEQISTRFVRRGMRITTAVLADDSGRVQAVWFNQPYREKQLAVKKNNSKNGRGVETVVSPVNPAEKTSSSAILQNTGSAVNYFYFSGRFDFARGRYQLTSPSVEIVDRPAVNSARVLPVYPARAGLKPNLTRKILTELKPLMLLAPETLPEEIIEKEKLLSRGQALLNLHFPENIDMTEKARRRLAFEELFQLILAAKLNRSANQKLRAPRIEFNQPRIAEFVRKLPFQLTDAQRRALWEILQDFEKSGSEAAGEWAADKDEKTKNGAVPNVAPMNRLLQGDVGSGKTVVAGAAAYQAFLGGYQTALMAPTEILAGQHADTLDKLLSPFGVKVALLTGSVKGAARRNLLKNLKNGRIDLVVGTHALFQPAVEFKNLGFVIIDEQHRFGVKQRNALLAKVADEASQTENLRAENLAQNSAGNDLAKADDTAKNSAPDSPGSAAEISALKTSALKSKNLMPHLLTMTATPIPRSLQLTIFGDLDVSILDELPKGRQPIQTKIVAPTARARVDDFLKNQLRRGRQIYIITSQISESQTASAAAETEFKKAKNIFKNFRVGLLHGKLSSDEKDKIMGEFSRHEIDVLVATTVVEVGVDVPNAAAMLILNADHFGLSQLHQLRGRVGRGANQSFCFLMTSDSAAPSQRLREIERSTDGFHLAEVDLKLRGPGEIYGTLQHGSLNLQIANLSDTKTIAKARRAADWFMKSGQNLLQYKELAAKVREFQRLTVLD